jgi:hypothetical protein
MLKKRVAEVKAFKKLNDGKLPTLGYDPKDVAFSKAFVDAALKPTSSKVVEDVVNHPSHYTKGNTSQPVEVIHYLEDKMTPEEFIGYCKGNTLKYLSRAGKKDATLQDYKKAQWYLNHMIKTMEKKPGDTAL